MLQEFRKFAMRGNVLDMAVGIIIGGAFGKIVTSLVNDVIMPPIGQLMGKVNFGNLFISLNGVHYDTLQAAKDAGAATLNIGLFINTVIDFIIVAFAIFMVLQAIEKMKRREAVSPAPSLPPAAPPRQELLLEEIRDLLKKR
jgi:large conductance mechanosensitive channel